VSTVLAALAQHGLTLENFSSVQEQQLGGWTQVAAHGTGASLPTVEEQIVRMRLVTPARGVLELSEEAQPGLFRLAKAGLGSLGVVSQLTLRCVPRHRLHERTWVVSRREARRNHVELLRRYRHLRYMWLPHTDRVVVVASNPVPAGAPDPRARPPSVAPQQRVDPLVRLLQKLRDRSAGGARAEPESDEWLRGLSFAALRDRLLEAAPLDPEHVKQVNAAEAEYWQRAAGERVADSTEVLGFECGGPQWVLEVAFPVGRLDELGGRSKPLKDLDFVEDVLRVIEERNIAAPCPIEQRWTSSSSSPLSPAHADDPSLVHSWVGVIMYLAGVEGEDGEDGDRVEEASMNPSHSESSKGESSKGESSAEGEAQRKGKKRAGATQQEITAAFDEYVHAIEPLMDKYDAVPHWAKLEIPRAGQAEWEGRRDRLLRRVRARYPVEAFNAARKEVDPKGILSNSIVNAVFGPGEERPC